MITVTIKIEEGAEVVMFSGAEAKRVGMSCNCVAVGPTDGEAHMNSTVLGAIKAAFDIEAKRVGVLGAESVERRFPTPS